MSLKYIDLTEFRKHLHQHPELSGQEINTSKYIKKNLELLNPDKIITDIGGHGIAAIFNDNAPCKTLLFRADIDALPIQEKNDFEYKSKIPGVAHKCGHDGHSAILMGLAQKIAGDKSLKHRIALLFQPAEETAQGALAVINDPKFKEIAPDYCFGLHNLPGYSLGSLIIRNGIFASSSVGMIIDLKGETSHAGHPENGRSPVLAMTSIINAMLAVPQLHTSFSDAALTTIIYARLGEIAFGTSPGYAQVMATLRSHTDRDMDILKNKSSHIVKAIAEAHNLDYTIDWTEYFPALVNDSFSVQTVRYAAEHLHMKIIEKDKPFPWSEDFAYFTSIKSAFFGLGSGTDHPQLHNSDYDFPDELIDVGSELFHSIILQFPDK